MSQPHRIAALVTACCLLATGLTGCGASRDTTVGHDTDSSTSTPKKKTASTPDTTPATPSETTVDQTITNDVLGHTIHVDKTIDGWDGLKGLESKYATLEGSTVVLVHVNVTAGDDYYTSVNSMDFRLVDDGTEYTDTHGLYADRLSKAGYTPLGDVRHGTSGEGWLLFVDRHDTGSHTLRYKRLAAGTNAGTTIEAKDYDVPLQ